MDFRDYAAKEASALLTRVVGGSADTSRQRLKAFRSAIEGAAKALESALTSPPQFEQELTELVARLGKAATAEAEAAALKVAAEAEAAARSVAEETRLATNALREELNEALDGKESTAAALQGAIEAQEATAVSLRIATEAKEAIAAALKTATDAKESLAASLTAAQDEQDSLSASLKAAHAEKEELAVALAAETREKESVARAFIELRAETEQLRSAVDQEKGRAEAVRLELAKATELWKKADAARAEAVAAHDKEAYARESTQEELRTIRRHMEAARTEAENISTQLESAVADRARLEEALAEAQNQVIAIAGNVKDVSTISEANASRIRELEDAEHDHQRERADLEARLSVATAAEQSQLGRDSAAVALLDSLVAGFQNLGGARNIDDALKTLVQHLAAEFSRAASFRVKDTCLEGEYNAGFDLNTDVSKVMLPLGMDSVLTRAAASSRTEYLAGSDLNDANVPFGGSPTYALALPVVVNGETLAILYADNAGDAGDGSSLELKTRFADALMRHGVTVLTRLAAEMRAQAELRTYATSLVNEIEQMYRADVDAGRLPDELQGRLKANLEYARSIFANRTALECPEAAALLEEELAGVISSPEVTPFGRDLGIVTGRTGARAAEAS